MITPPKIRRPGLGRPFDERLTAEVISQTPALAGVVPFDPTQDVDLISEIESLIQQSGGALIGDLRQLRTTQKGSIVDAINELRDQIMQLAGGGMGGGVGFMQLDFAPQARPISDEPDWPNVGPVFSAQGTILRATQIRVPLRSANVQDGDVIRLTVAEVIPGGAELRVVGSLDQRMSAGASEAVFSGEFVVPYGSTCAFMVGLATPYVGQSDPGSNRFYNGPLDSSLSNTLSARADRVGGPGASPAERITATVNPGPSRVITVVGFVSPSAPSGAP